MSTDSFLRVWFQDYWLPDCQTARQFLSHVWACSFLGHFALQVSSSCNWRRQRKDDRVVIRCGALVVILKNNNNNKKKNTFVIQSEDNKGLGHLQGHTRANYSGVHLLHALLKLLSHLLNLHSTDFRGGAYDVHCKVDSAWLSGMVVGTNGLLFHHVTCKIHKIMLQKHWTQASP